MKTPASTQTSESTLSNTATVVTSTATPQPNDKFQEALDVLFAFDDAIGYKNEFDMVVNLLMQCKDFKKLTPRYKASLLYMIQTVSTAILKLEHAK